MNVVFRPEVIETIKGEAEAYSDTETGGVWLGCWDGDTCFITHHIDSGENAEHGKTYFSYDVEYVSQCAEEIIHSVVVPLNVIGYWHSHPSGCTSFSVGDAELNTLYAQATENRAICGIVTLQNGFELNLYQVTLSLQYEKIDYTIELMEGI